MIPKLTLLNFFILTSFFVNAQHSIEGKVVGFENGTKVYISQYIDDVLVKTDSTEIKNSTFTIKSNATPETDLYFIELDTTQEYSFPFIMESGAIKFNFDKEDPSLANVSGTMNNDLMTSYNKEALQIQNEIINFQNQNQKKFMEAQQKGDQVIMQSLMDQITKIQQKYVDQNKNFISSYKGKEFLESIKKLEIAQKEKSIKQQKIAIGQKAPDFTANTPNGKAESLHKNLGSKATIIDFWASWCGPCRQENPNVVALYNKYKAQGLKIVGVSLDKEKEAWVKAIADDKLDWLQISNLKFWDDAIAKDYAVEAIPATFILDANGTIVAKDLKGAALDAKIAELLK